METSPQTSHATSSECHWWCVFVYCSLIIIHIFIVIQRVSVGWEVDTAVSVTASIDDSGVLGVMKNTQLFH